MKIEARKISAIVLSLIVLLVVCFSISAKTDSSEKFNDIVENDYTENNSDVKKESWDGGFDSGWHVGFKSGWDSGWKRRGELFPNFDESSPLGLKGIKKLQVVVFRDEGDDYDSVIRNYVESRLRAVGITIIENDSEGFNSAIISVSYFTIKKNSKTRVRINLCLHQDVLIPRGIEDDNIMHYLVRVCTRREEQILIHAPEPKSQIKEFLQEEMDSFINDWLKENPKSSDIIPKER